MFDVSRRAQIARRIVFVVLVLLVCACSGHGIGVVPPGSKGANAVRSAASGPSGAFEQLVLQSNPTQYFELEETGCCTAANIGSSGVSGTYTSSSVTYSLAGPLQGETSTAIGLPGNTGTTSISMGVALPNPSTSGAFSVEDWVYPIFTSSSTSVNSYYAIWGIGSGSRLLVNNQGSAAGTLLTQFGGTNFTSKTRLVPNAWNQVVFVYDGSKEYFYINGALDSSTTVSSAALTSAYYVGQFDTSANYKFDGRIGQHIVFPTALSASVIESHYSAATTGVVTSPSPTSSPTTSPSGVALVQHANGAMYAPSTVTVSFSAVPKSGDLLLVFFHNNGNTSGTANTYTPPSGWTQLDEDTAHTGEGYEAFYHVAGSSEGTSYAFTPACACREHAWVAAEYSGATIDQHGFNFVNSLTTWATPSETPSKAGDLAVVAMMPFANGLTWTNAAGWTVDLGPTTTWSNELLHESQTGTSSVSETSTLSAASKGYAAIVLLASSGSGPVKVDWDTWGMSRYRNSYNPVETRLTTSNVSGLHEIWSLTAGGVFTDEPVLAANVTGTSAGTADMLYVGDAHADFYAINAANGSVLWSKTLDTQTINGGATATKGCYDQPGGVYGIGGSATIDRSSNLVYVVDALGNLYAFDLATGTQKVGPVIMWPDQSGVNITNDYGALNEDSGAGVIYVPSGAHCGLPNYGGIQRYTISSGAVTHWYTEGTPPATPQQTFGGVWGPGGAVIDPRYATNSSMNNIYFGTAYGPVGSGMYPYSVVRMTESLGVVAANNPVSQTFGPDLDFGDTPLVFAPKSSGCGSELVAAESKNSILYVYNADSIGSGPIQTIQLGTLSQDGENVGTAAYDPTKNLVFIDNGSDSSNTATGLLHGLVAFTVTASCQLSLAWQFTVGPNQTTDGPPAPPTVANGIVYYVDGPGAGCSPVGQTGCIDTSDFYAFNETNGSVLFHTTLPGALFTPPVVVNGNVYLTSWDGNGPGLVYDFGL